MDSAKHIEQIPIEYHADDFGLFKKQSQRILDCYHNGRLNGLSVLPNGRDLLECMKMMDGKYGDIAVTVHLNLIEGASLCGHQEVPSITNRANQLCCKFIPLLFRSFLPGRKRLLAQIKREFSAQIQEIRKFLPNDLPLRLDSHAHYHMIPIVFDALMEVIREEQLRVSYIRIPKEYPMLYVRRWGKLQDVSILNFAKVLILNVLAMRNQRKYARELGTMEKKLFMGVLLSGRMYVDNVRPIFADAVKLAKRKGLGLEILAHPGGVYEDEDIAQLTCLEDVDFMTSSRRRAEATLYKQDLGCYED